MEVAVAEESQCRDRDPRGQVPALPPSSWACHSISVPRFPMYEMRLAALSCLLTGW